MSEVAVRHPPQNAVTIRPISLGAIHHRVRAPFFVITPLLRLMQATTQPSPCSPLFPTRTPLPCLFEAVRQATPHPPVLHQHELQCLCFSFSFASLSAKPTIVHPSISCSTSIVPYELRRSFFRYICPCLSVSVRTQPIVQEASLVKPANIHLVPKN